MIPVCVPCIINSCLWLLILFEDNTRRDLLSANGFAVLILNRAQTFLYCRQYRLCKSKANRDYLLQPIHLIFVENFSQDNISRQYIFPDLIMHIPNLRSLASCLEKLSRIRARVSIPISRFYFLNAT